MRARLSDLKRVLAKQGIILHEPKKGSHYKFVKGSVMYPVPAHNGLRSEIGAEYVKGLCRRFGLDFGQLVKDL